MKGYKDAHAQARMRAYAREHMLSPYEFAVEVNGSRFQIPRPNRKKFDLEAEDTVTCYKAAFDMGDQCRIDWIRKRWENRLEILMRAGCHNTPPMLIQKVGESTREWLNRCYKAWR